MTDIHVPSALWIEADRCARLFGSIAERKALKALRDVVKQVARQDGRWYGRCGQCGGLEIETESGERRCLECEP